MKKQFALSLILAVPTWYLTSVVTFSLRKNHICDSLDDVDVFELDQYAVVDSKVSSPRTTIRTDDYVTYDDEGGSHHESRTHSKTQCPPGRAYTTMPTKLTSQPDFNAIISLLSNSTIFNNKNNLPEHYTADVKGTRGCSPKKPLTYWVQTGTDKAEHICKHIIFNPGRLHGKVRGSNTMSDVFFKDTCDIAVPAAFFVLFFPLIVVIYKKTIAGLSDHNLTTYEPSEITREPKPVEDEGKPADLENGQLGQPLIWS